MMVSWSGKQLVKTFHHTTWPPFRLVVVSIFDFDDGEDFGDNGHDDNVDHDYDVESDHGDDHHDFMILTTIIKGGAGCFQAARG